MNESFKNVSLGKLLSLIEQVPKDVFILKIGNIDWMNHYRSSIKNNEIPEEREGYYEIATDAGTNLL